MAKMKDLVYGNTEQLEQLFNGQTVSGHTYNENDLYIEELGDDIELGATGSGTQINNQNQLVVSLSASDIPSLDASKITSGTFADARIASASTWNNKQNAITSSAKLSADLVDDSSATNKFVTASDKTTWNNKQDALVSGTNIKTINNESLLGSGNIQVQLEWEHVETPWDTNPGTLAQAQAEGYNVGEEE